MSRLFRDIAPRYMRLAMKDFGLTTFQAAGMFGNFGHETGGFLHWQEIKPVVKGSRGGFGWAQWTGQRRKEFEAYCARNWHDPKSHDTNYGFLYFELTGTEKRALSLLKRTTTLSGATLSFMRNFERPGAPHEESRLKWAGIALDALARDGVIEKPVQPSQEPAAQPKGFPWWWAVAGAIAAAVAAFLGLR